MADTVQNITDTELSSRLKTSFIDPNQQKQLEGLIPKMSETEKGELLKLIDRSHEEKRKADAAYQENMEALGKEYKQQLKVEDKSFRVELEGIERTENVQNLKVIEAEVSIIGAPNSKLKAHGSSGHFLRNLIFLIIFLGLLAGGGLYMLNAMS